MCNVSNIVCFSISKIIYFISANMPCKSMENVDASLLVMVETGGYPPLR